jgi:hypothetical protein
MSPDELFPEISLVEGGKVAKIWSDYVDEDSEVAYVESKGEAIDEKDTETA